MYIFLENMIRNMFHIIMDRGTPVSVISVNHSKRELTILVVRTTYSLLLLLNKPPCPNGMGIVGFWCPKPCTKAIETLYYFP